MEIGVVISRVLLRLGIISAAVVWATCLTPRLALAQQPASEPASEQRMLRLGTGDSVTLQVYGQPDMTVTVYVSDDGTIPVPLAGAVRVTGMSPSEAAKQVESALRSGGFLIDPNVTITVIQSRSQRVSVLGEVRTPGRYGVESNTTIFDLLAQAGGTTELSSDVVFVLRTDKAGKVERIPVNIKNLTATDATFSGLTLKTGDSVFVPKAAQFYILGAVRTPNVYKLQPGMTIVQAIALGGGLTETASDSRIEIKRKLPDGKLKTMRGQLTDEVQPDDVIRVKESIF
ncbi:MAG: SLBB domain-containing protein [Steroidobacteraceae bacterium]